MMRTTDGNFKEQLIELKTHHAALAKRICKLEACMATSTAQHTIVTCQQLDQEHVQDSDTIMFWSANDYSSNSNAIFGNAK